MTKKTILFVLLFSISILASAQDKMTEKLSKELCKCLQKNNVKSLDNEKANSCFETMLFTNMNDMLKFYKADSVDELETDKIFIEVGKDLSMNCDYYLNNIIPSDQKIPEGMVQQENLDCSQLKKGDFFYVQQHPITHVNDTTYVTIKDRMYLERMNSGKNYSLLDIEWKDNCHFNLIFKSSNDLIKMNMSKPEDIYNYEVMSSTSNSYVIKAIWGKQEYKFELFIVE